MLQADGVPVPPLPPARSVLPRLSFLPYTDMRFQLDCESTPSVSEHLREAQDIMCERMERLDGWPKRLRELRAGLEALGVSSGALDDLISDLEAARSMGEDWLITNASADLQVISKAHAEKGIIQPPSSSGDTIYVAEDE
jgi:hypothetical protein